MKLEIKKYIDNSDCWINSDQAANYLGISRKTLLNECYKGMIPYYKFGRRNRYKRSDLDKVILTNNGSKEDKNGN